MTSNKLKLEQLETPDTILSTDGQTNKVKPVYPTFNFVEAGNIKKAFYARPKST